MQPTVSLHHLLLEIGNNREWDFHAEVLLDVPRPRNVAENALHRVAERHHTAAPKTLEQLRELDELSGAYRSEIRGMREWNDPLSLGPLGKPDWAMGAVGLKVRSSIGEFETCSGIYDSSYYAPQCEKYTIRDW
jgi:hypothetical protein